jgi:hypothetical protein
MYVLRTALGTDQRLIDNPKFASKVPAILCEYTYLGLPITVADLRLLACSLVYRVWRTICLRRH